MSNNKEKIKQTVGTVLIPFMRERAERIAREEMSMTVGKRNVIDACLRAGMARKMLNSSNEQQLSEYHRNFWENEKCVEYHQGFRDFVAEAFRDKYSFVLDEMQAIVNANPDFTTLVEIGCGGGSVLDYVAQNLDGIDRFVGVDLSPDIIEENKLKYPADNIEWVADNAQTWIEQNGQANWIYFSFRGVLEYFTEQDLNRMYADVAERMSPAIFATMEPMALDHSIENDHHSSPYGTEYTWSHNYPRYYEQNGYTLRHRSVQEYDDHKICAIVATVGLPEPVKA